MTTPGWTLHWLEAEGDLQAWRPAIEAEIGAAFGAIAVVLPPTPLDIVIQRVAGATIPELGMVGHAYRRRCFGFTLDPDNPNFAKALSDGAARRMVVHEAHHCMRMQHHRSWGMTLGEALVSEGLAGCFTQAVCGGGPEPWERAVDAAGLHAHAPDRATLASPRYDHNAWFFGTGSQPRWLGYAMGAAIVQAWAEATVPEGAAWVETPAEPILEHWLRRPAGPVSAVS